MIKAYHQFVLLFVVSCLLLTAACTIETPVMPLTKEERQLIDSIYIEESKLLKVEMDSLCDLKFDRFVNHAVDSIIEDRLQEIERLINRQ